MRSRLRFALPLALAALLLFPATSGAQEVRIGGLTRLASVPTSPLLRHSDLAFWGNTAYAGTYSGFRIFDITNPAAPVMRADVSCTGGAVGSAGQGDVSVWRANGRTLLFRSVDSPQSKPECDRVPASVGWEGIDIFDVTNPASPQYITGVATDCGSHTHTLVPDLRNNRVLLYISSYPASGLSATPTQWGNTCERVRPDGTQGHDKISIVSVPLNAPQTASVIAEPQFNLTGDFVGTPGFKGCHDITVFMELNIAAGACLTEGVMLDISSPAAPRVTNRLVNPNIDNCARGIGPLCLWHSATFTWDGRYVVFGDEAGGGGAARCRDQDLPTEGAFWLHSVANPTFPISSFKLPRAQNQAWENCTAHIMNFVPVNGRYVMPSSWYAGGTSVVDWSDIRSPAEMAFFEVEPGPLGAQDPAQTNTWTSYWYNGAIYTMDGGGGTPATPTTAANGGQRGFEVFRLDVPWRTSAWNMTRFNPQTQEGLISCRVVAHSGQLRARRAGTVHVQVRARGQAIVPGQAVASARVVVRGPGVNIGRQTNAQGEVSFRVRPARRGTLRVNVPAARNMLGCNTSRRVAAAPRRAVRPGPALTGRRL